MTTCPHRQLLLAIAVSFVAGSVAWLAAQTAFDPKRNPHAHFREAAACPKCHVTVAGKPDPDRILPESVDFCLGCHGEQQLGRSHPIRVRPRDKYWKMKVPPEFRLDDDGRMMCLTCHVAHGAFLSTVKAYPKQKPENPDAAGGTPRYYKTFFARRTDPVNGWAVLCDACHKYL